MTTSGCLLTEMTQTSQQSTAGRQQVKTSLLFMEKLILQYHQEVLILMYKLMHLIYTLTVQRCLDKTTSLI